MARISGVNVPNKHTDIALTYIFGIGRHTAKRICQESGIDHTVRIDDLSQEELAKVRQIIDNDYTVEGALRRNISMNIKRQLDLGSYRGLRHRKRLPVRGQRTHTNARTRKGKAVAIAGKKQASAKK